MDYKVTVEVLMPRAQRSGHLHTTDLFYLKKINTTVMFFMLCLQAEKKAEIFTIGTLKHNRHLRLTWTEHIMANLKLQRMNFQ